MQKSRLLSLLMAATLCMPAARLFAQDEKPAIAVTKSKDEADTTKLVASAQGKLAFELIKHFGAAHKETDITISPASLASVLGVVGIGADAPMRAALVKSLGFTGPAADGFAALRKARQTINADNGGIFQSADRLVFASEPNEILRAGLEKLQVEFDVDDLRKAEAIAKLNDWVKAKTQGAIPEILSTPLDNPSFVALNALHFKGRWKSPFDPKGTVPKPFTGIDGKAEDVAMMHGNESERLYRTDGNFIGVDLPFAGDRFSLVIVTRSDKPARPAEFEPVSGWLTGAGFEARRGDLALPRFSVKGSEELLPALDSFGLEKARHSPTALSFFGAGTNLSQIVQRTSLDVDEEGAEAAAATIVVGTRSLEEGKVLQMTVDKPFIYALRDRASGLILVAGYVGHAPKGKV